MSRVCISITLTSSSPRLTIRTVSCSVPTARQSIPRVVIAAPASGHGKTAVATGLLAAYRTAGLTVSPHNVGPDYIDPRSAHRLS